MGPRLLRRRAWSRLVTAVCAAVALTATAAAAGDPAGGAVGYHPRAGLLVEVSRGCQGMNAETEQAVDYPYVYVTWMGCGGIGFARSIDGGRSFGHPLRVPGSAARGQGTTLPRAGWDPAIAISLDGTIYVSYMIYRNGYAHPRIAVSYDHGKTFAQLFSAMPPDRYKNNWGDRDFIAIAPDGTIYLTWVYGQHLPAKPGKPFASNAVIQKSADGGRRWSRIIPVSPGYPDHDDVAAAPLLALRRGRIDVLMWAGSGIRRSVLPVDDDYFTSSADGGATWSRPVLVAPTAGRINPSVVTWIDADIGIDAAGTLYATWDTQHPGGDIGWLSYSINHGRSWSPARRVTPDHDTAEHIMAVAGGRPGIAYVGYLKGGPVFVSRSPRPFSLYTRVFSVRRGWLSSPLRVSRTYGNRHGWPGDTFGISVMPRCQIMLSWGIPSGATTGQIWAARVRDA